MSPAFPRTIASRLTSPPEFPDGLEQWGQSGRGQFRSHDNVGRVWEEIYPAVDLLTANGRALIAAINQARREKIIWDIQPPHWRDNYGVGGGSPAIDGGSQTGDTLNIKNGPATITNWLRWGDIVKIAGLQLIYDVRGNVDTDSLGEAELPISPPIFAGGSPADSAAIEIDASLIFFKAVLSGAQMPDIEAHGVMAAGMTLVWREQPS